MPIISTRGVASAKALGLASGLAATYIEDVFSTYLYTGNGTTQTITNGIDLAGKGGLTWIKERGGIGYHNWTDTVRGATKDIFSNATDFQGTTTNGLTAFGSTGFTVGSQGDYNGSARTFVSWTFRKQPKFFDVVTYTGTGANRTIAHSLDAVPGSIIVKRTDIAANWAVYHRSLANTQYLVLNTTAAAATGATWWNSTTPTSAVFSVGTDASVNASGGTYVAYIFAHDAGGFGLTGTDNVISCGTYTGVGANLNINLGYEPQWVMIKCTTDAVNWIIFDTMRGLPTSGNGKDLYPNVTDAEGDNSALSITSTGFLARTGIDGQVNATGRSYIYIAIRRGPMKVPTSGTSVFSIGSRAGTSAVATVNAGFPQDSWLVKNKLGNADSVDWCFNFFDRLRSNTGYRLSTAFTVSEDTSINFITSYLQNGITLPATGYTATNGLGYNYIDYLFRRAPGFFDVVCYTGTNFGTMIHTHNLSAIPQLIIVKSRTVEVAWAVQHESFTGGDGYLVLNTTAAKSTAASWFGYAEQNTDTTFKTRFNLNTVNQNYVAYLFATCPGVSKVGGYTGNGTTQTIACGFATGARFILIKRTDAVGDWYVWDSARGIVAGNDPHLSLNTTVAEVTTDDSVDTASSGFIVNQLAATNINVSAATYIFLAIS